jgi:hypothetical protein
VTEDGLQRVGAARERMQAKAKEFYESAAWVEREAQRAQDEQLHGCARGPIDREAIGTAYDQNGWMPKADYLEMQRIISAFQAGTSTDDGALETMLRFLGESKESIVRARVFAFLGELVKQDSITPDRVTRIEEAIAPWREGPEDLDILYWARVRQAIDARSA